MCIRDRYGTEVAPLRWFGLLAGDAADGEFNASDIIRSSEPSYVSREAIGLKELDNATVRQLLQ